MFLSLGRLMTFLLSAVYIERERERESQYTDAVLNGFTVVGS